MYRCRTEVAIYCQSGTSTQRCCDSLGDLDATAYGDKIYIFRVTLKKEVPHVTAHDIAFTANVVGDSPYMPEHFSVYLFCYIHDRDNISSGALVRHSHPFSVTR